MVFKRRDRRGWLAWVREMFYPTGGFRRATQYVIHRMRRLPDRPHRIARGVFAGSLIGFLPLPGLQFLGAWGLAWAMRGNVLAALLATFNSNPITTPFFAVGAISLGHWMLGIDTPLTAEAIGDGFGRAGTEIWHNFLAIFGPEHMHWDGLAQFWSDIYLPYFIGALGPGILLSLICYYITIPLVEAYQKARVAKFKERSDKRLALRERLAALALRGADAAKDPVPGTKQGDDDTPPAA
ncbi:MAG: DUF2062 domain-containing protein [Pseudotabrizicola sp.]|uniref:DUF2062 domain-containing protein n=1 Tax=Pseudotabrizicola sp. TaxID=2939647 RepID=UPI002719D047|nr:DUF2062 domain-containing protein [Pseudotabrizicola sp.]MDO9639513.1 DUF2062 domain-containing protein [Pseudotabrizicola sp.]